MNINHILINEYSFISSEVQTAQNSRGSRLTGSTMKQEEYDHLKRKRCVEMCVCVCVCVCVRKAAGHLRVPQWQCVTLRDTRVNICEFSYHSCWETNISISIDDFVWFPYTYTYSARMRH